MPTVGGCMRVRETSSVSHQKPDGSFKVMLRGYGDLNICEEKLFTYLSLHQQVFCLCSSG